LYWGKQLKGSVRWVQENRIQLGTFRTAFQTRFGLQWGNLKGLPFFGQRLEIQDQGFSFFTGVMMAVNIHDYSLSGSLFESNSIYPLQAEGSRATVQAGVMWHRSQWRFITLFNYSSSYITTQRNKQHPYLNISIFRLF
jgi:hypothetical protein